MNVQKQAEQAREKLYQNRKLFETFMENSPILSWITDTNSIIRYLNPAYLKNYHLKKEDIGKPSCEVFGSFFTKSFCENNELFLQTNQVLKTIERGITPDNKEHVYEVVRFPIKSDGKTFIGGWAIDITDEIQLRESLNASLDRLKQSEKDLKEALGKEHQLNDLKSRFVSIASHEFRTPLSTMLSSTFLLEEYTTTEQQINRLKHINKIKESVLHMNSLLDDLLSLGRLDEGKTAVSYMICDIPELISEVTEELEPLRKKGQKLNYHAKGKNHVATDKKLLKNILVNLISNAFKFSGENKQIWISYDSTKEGLHLVIQDEGIGISSEDQKHLFETFFRAKNVQNIQGTGLGLHIVRRYIQLLKGNLQLESELNKGTKVIVFLPTISEAD